MHIPAPNTLLVFLLPPLLRLALTSPTPILAQPQSVAPFFIPFSEAEPSSTSHSSTHAKSKSTSSSRHHHKGKSKSTSRMTRTTRRVETTTTTRRVERSSSSSGVGVQNKAHTVPSSSMSSSEAPGTEGSVSSTASAWGLSPPLPSSVSSISVSSSTFSIVSISTSSSTSSPSSSSSSTITTSPKPSTSTFGFPSISSPSFTSTVSTTTSPSSSKSIPSSSTSSGSHSTISTSSSMSKPSSSSLSSSSSLTSVLNLRPLSVSPVVSLSLSHSSSSAGSSSSSSSTSSPSSTTSSSSSTSSIPPRRIPPSATLSTSSSSKSVSSSSSSTTPKPSSSSSSRTSTSSTTSSATTSYLPSVPSSHATYLNQVNSTLTTLQTYYNTTSGLYSKNGWWMTANALTVLADSATLLPHLVPLATTVFNNTFTTAQNPDTDGWPSFINDFYDDEGWWALFWIKAYDLVKDDRYLNMSRTIFQDMTSSWGAPCGGVWWDKHHWHQTSISTALLVSVAAHLANRVPDPKDKQTYYDWAVKVWTWFDTKSNLISPRGWILDGLDMTTCQPSGAVWSYNQGVILGGLVEMHFAALGGTVNVNGNGTEESAAAAGKTEATTTTYLHSASFIATAAINRLGGTNGILREVCEPTCGATGAQFKGIFMRNLQTLHAVQPSVDFRDFIIRNADSVWANDRGPGEGFAGGGQDKMKEEWVLASDGSGGGEVGGDTTLGLDWAGPYANKTVNWSTHSSAMEALIAAAAVVA